MKIVIILNSIRELDSLLSSRTRGEAFDCIPSIMSSPEDGEAVAYFVEELSKVIDARKEKK